MLEKYEDLEGAEFQLMAARVVVEVELGVEEVGEQKVGEANLSVVFSHSPFGASEAHVVAAS